MDVNQIWSEYQKGLSYLQSKDLFNRAEECHRFVNGDQWAGLKSGDERPAQLNILRPIMKNATALVGQNAMTINYSCMNYDAKRAEYAKVCEKMNQHASRTWEKLKMDRYAWQVLEDAYIAGDSIAYFFDGEMKMELIDTTNIMLGDENNPNIQEQPYILIIQRRYVDEVRAEAKANHIDEADIESIVPDNETDGQINGETEVDNEKKLISVMRLWKQGGTIHVCRSTKTVMYQPDTEIKGLTLYPIAKYSWNPEKGTARGLGEIWDKIPNQLSINKNLFRFEAAVKSSAFPHKIYNSNAISDEDVKKLSYPDSNIPVDDRMDSGIDKFIRYLQPANISPYAKDIWKDTIELTRQLSGAGDNLENINPELASGAAINAARDAKQLNVNSQVAAYKQWIEDIALIWWDMWVAYNPNGLKVTIEGEGNEYEETIPAEILSGLKVDVRIDVSPNNPFSKYAQELGLKELFASGAISFDEYVASLDDDGTMPKGKLQEILDKRKAAQNNMAAQKIMELSQMIQQLQARNQQLEPAAQKLVELSRSEQNVL